MMSCSLVHRFCSILIPQHLCPPLSFAFLASSKTGRASAERGEARESLFMRRQVRQVLESGLSEKLDRSRHYLSCRRRSARAQRPLQCSVSLIRSAPGHLAVHGRRHSSTPMYIHFIRLNRCLLLIALGRSHEIAPRKTVRVEVLQGSKGERLPSRDESERKLTGLSPTTTARSPCLGPLKSKVARLRAKKGQRRAARGDG